MESEKTSTTKVVLKAIAGNSALAVMKFIGWFLTPNPSMLAEAIHSVADTINQLLLFIGIKHGKQGPTRTFPWGKGRARYVWNLISAVGIFFLGFGVTAYHGFYSLFHGGGDGGHELNLFSIGTLIFAFFYEGYVCSEAFKVIWQGKGNKGFFEYVKYDADPTILAVVFEDGIAVLGILFAGLGIWLSHALNSHVPDAVAAILIAFLLGVVAILLAYSNAQLLIGKSLPQEEELELKQYIESLPQVEKVISIKTSIIGPDRTLLSAEIEFHGSSIIDKQQISKDSERIKQGEDPTPILVDTSERAIRLLGNYINTIEKQISREFPEISNIELEVN